MIITQAQSFFISFGPQHTEHGPEDFFLIDTHIFGDIIEQCAAQEITIFIALHFKATAINGEFCALFDTNVDVTFHAV